MKNKKKTYELHYLKEFSNELERQNEQKIKEFDELASKINEILNPEIKFEKALKYLKEISKKEQSLSIREFQRAMEFARKVGDGLTEAGYSKQKIMDFALKLSSNKRAFYVDAGGNFFEAEKEKMKEFVPLEFWGDKKFILEAVKINGIYLKFANAELRKDEDCWVEAIKNIVANYDKEEAAALIKELWYLTNSSRLEGAPYTDLALNVLAKTRNKALVEEKLEYLDERNEILSSKLESLSETGGLNKMKIKRIEKNIDRNDRERDKILDKMCDGLKANNI